MLTGRDDLSNGWYYYYSEEDNESLEMVKSASLSSISTKAINSDYSNYEVWASSLDHIDILPELLSILPPSFFLENDFITLGENLIFDDYNETESFWVKDVKPVASTEYAYYYSFDVISNAGSDDSVVMVLTCIPMKLFENTELLVLDRDKPVAKNITFAPPSAHDFILEDGRFFLDPTSLSFFVEYGGPSTLWSLLNWSTDDFFDYYDPYSSEPPKSSTELFDINETSVTF